MHPSDRLLALADSSCTAVPPDHDPLDDRRGGQDHHCPTTTSGLVYAVDTPGSAMSATGLQGKRVGR